MLNINEEVLCRILAAAAGKRLLLLFA